MTKKRIMTVAAAAAAATLMGVSPAQAEEIQSPTAADVTTAAADGHLHLYYGYNFNYYCGGYEGNSVDWGACRNSVASLWNNGYPGSYDDVWVYWGRNHSGARRGVYNGVALADLSDWTFDPNTGAGSGQTLIDNISSHQWTNLP